MVSSHSNLNEWQGLGGLFFNNYQMPGQQTLINGLPNNLKGRYQ
jgi:hypothetical protein